MLHWLGLGTQLPSGHIVPEQQKQESWGEGVMPKRLRGGGTSFNVPLQTTTTDSGAPRSSAVNERTFGSPMQLCAPSTWPYHGPPRIVQNQGAPILTCGCELSLKYLAGITVVLPVAAAAAAMVRTSVS
jgi:hypothetical protein